MKKLLVLIIGFTLLLSTGCVTDPPRYYFDLDELLDEVVKIELVECKNDNPIMISVNDSSIPGFDLNSIQLIKELPYDRVKDFLQELSTVTFHIENESVNSPVGYAVLIYTKNNEIIVLSCTVLNNYGYSMVAKFSADGKFINHIARFADEPKYKRMIEKYFNL